MKEICLVGLNFRSIEVESRGAFRLTADACERILAGLREAEEAVLLSTCLRVEIYAVGIHPERIVDLLRSEIHADRAQFDALCQTRIGSHACRHLFRVTSGLESAMLGETEVVHQIKKAWRETGFPGPILDVAFSRAIFTSRRVRTETALGRRMTSLASLAVRAAESRRGQVAEQRVVIVGAGHLAERLCRTLSQRGARDVVVLNRRRDRAELLAQRFGYESGALEDFENASSVATVVFGAAASSKPLFDLSKASFPLVVDLGSPSNFINCGSEFVGLDEIVESSNRNRQLSLNAIPHANEIIEAEVRRLEDARSGFSSEPIQKVNAEWRNLLEVCSR